MLARTNDHCPSNRATMASAMRTFHATSEGQNRLGRRELLERYANDQWVADHMTPEQGGDPAGQVVAMGYRHHTGPLIKNRQIIATESMAHTTTQAAMIAIVMRLGGVAHCPSASHNPPMMP